MFSNPKVLRRWSAIAFLLLLLVGIVMIIVHYTNSVLFAGIWFVPICGSLMFLFVFGSIKLGALAEEMEEELQVIGKQTHVSHWRISGRGIEM